LPASQHNLKLAWVRSYLIALGAGWILLSAAGVYYARSKGIAPGVAAPIVAAFLLEYAFYLVPGFAGLRDWLSHRVPVRLLALSLAISAIAPYLLYSLATGQFQAPAAIRLTALALAISFWYVWQRPTPVADLAMLALVVAPLIAKLFFKQIYTSPAPSVSLEILGHLMLIRLTVSVMLMLREVEGTGFGFLPTAGEWLIGLRYFAYFVPVGLALAMGLRMYHLRITSTSLLFAPFQFLGALWVIALFEEFLARGLFQRWLTGWTGRPNLALICASAAYGLSHLWYHHAFPNWKDAILTTALGLFCGRAYQRAGGIRAPMVTHALAATIYLTLLTVN
jgi:membrane protease YdiL (CAAX protease family)